MRKDISIDLHVTYMDRALLQLELQPSILPSSFRSNHHLLAIILVSSRNPAQSIFSSLVKPLIPPSRWPQIFGMFRHLRASFPVKEISIEGCLAMQNSYANNKHLQPRLCCEFSHLYLRAIHITQSNFIRPHPLVD
jgi:hypothetical protein